MFPRHRLCILPYDGGEEMAETSLRTVATEQLGNEVPEEDVSQIEPVKGIEFALTLLTSPSIKTRVQIANKVRFKRRSP